MPHPAGLFRSRPNSRPNKASRCDATGHCVASGTRRLIFAVAPLQAERRRRKVVVLAANRIDFGGSSSFWDASGIEMTQTRTAPRALDRPAPATGNLAARAARTTKSALFALSTLALSTLAMATLALPATAGGLVSEIKTGVLAHDVPDLWSGFRLESNSADINVEVILAPSLAFLGGTIQPALGASINTQGDTSHAYIDARWQIEGPSGLFFSAGLGAAIHDGELGPVAIDKKALGSRVLFHIPFEVGLRLDQHNSLSIYFEHTSNANLANFNEGMDRIGVRYGYRF